MSIRKSLHVMVLAVLLAGLFGWIVCDSPAKQVNAQEEATMDRPLLLAHYMPWYQTPETSGYWGWHWTMEHFDPASQNTAGYPEIASHYMPLTGPYDSQDPDLLEYQVLLMKISGIDGIIVDWYGTENFRDYAVLNAATNRLFEYTQRAGLLFAICYEDQTIRHMITENHIGEDEAHRYGQADMRYVQEHWFSDESYVRYNGQPLLFVFGPQYFRNPDDWETIFSVLPESPALVTLDGHLDWAALSSYPWPPMSMAGGIELSPAVLESYLTLFYRNARRRDVIVGSAFPAFHDIYAEAGVRSSYGYIAPRDGETFRFTLDAALQNNASIIQLVTWNDYGEGTIIEPTIETGYQYLEIVQQYRAGVDQRGFVYTAEDLRLPLQVFNLRKAHAGDASVNARLEVAFEAIIAGDPGTAVEIINGF